MITIISGTNRRNSYSLRMAKIVSSLLDERGIPHRVFSLEELSSSYVNNKINDIDDAEFDQVVERNIKPAEKFIFIVAEYNGGFPGILKTFIDSVHPKNFKTKKAALIGIASGTGGALRPLDQLTGVLHYLQVEVLSDKPKFSDIENKFDEHDHLKDEGGMKRINAMLDKFLNF